MLILFTFHWKSNNKYNLFFIEDWFRVLDLHHKTYSGIHQAYHALLTCRIITCLESWNRAAFIPLILSSAHCLGSIGIERNTPSGVIFSRTHNRNTNISRHQFCLVSDQWFSIVCGGPLHLVGMFQTPLKCLHASVFHPPASLRCYYRTMIYWVWRVFTLSVSGVTQRPTCQMIYLQSH